MVKPSWAVTKLMDAIGLRPLCSYRSEDPEMRLANSASALGSPRQKSRTVSRYLPFHSVHSGGNPPTWYPPSPTSQGSAMSFTCETTGSCWIRSKNADSLSTSWNWRASVLARSKRKPSTCMSLTQYRSESMISCSTWGAA